MCASVAMSLLLQATPVAPTTAKANLADALAGGKKWKPDAILIQAVGSRVGADGKHISWEYGFYSASAKTCAVVYVARGQSRAQESGGSTCQAPELKDFMDSDRAMEIARRSGITKPLANMAASVEKNRPTWTVMDGGGVATGDVILEIDAMSGAIISKITQR
jgi:hypothetical protein